ncbi:MAG: AAA family ATPase [Deltaproteobacteria bacterium]|nr:AAA family ATPase [Deltaproteobacteria bacterium]
MSISNVINSKKIFFVTGKGGTGKSTLVVALGRLSSIKQKTLIIDFDNKRSTIREILKCQSISTEPIKISDSLYFSHIEPEDALKFYLNSYLKSEFLINLALNLKPLRTFYNALPSAKEMLITYYIVHLIKHYDFEKIFIDMPASGHAELFFKIPYSAKGIFSRGPVIDIIDEMHMWLYSNEKSGIIQVALPEDVVISETMEYYDKFNSINHIKVLAVVVNKVYRFKHVELDILDSFLSEDIKSLYNYYLARFKEQRELIGKLSKKVNDIIEIPFFVGSNSLESILEYLTAV